MSEDKRETNAFENALASKTKEKGVASMSERIPLTDMKNGESGQVVDILGGRGVHSRLRALGMMNGQKITKLSAVFARGPVVVQVNGTQISLGFGISYKVIVKVN